MKGKYITTLIHMACISHKRDVKVAELKEGQSAENSVVRFQCKKEKRSFADRKRLETCTA